MIPIPVAAEDLDLRLRSIGMPTDAVVVCEALGPLEVLDHRLAGCIWKILGREVALTEEIPDYPFLRLSQGNTPLRQVQIWMWQICTLDTPAFVEYRWHPERGEHVHFVSMNSLNPSERQHQFKRLNHLFEITKYRYRLGRPLNSGEFQSAQELLSLLVPAVRSCWRQNIRPTQDRVLRMLPRTMSDRRLRQLCREMGIKWDDFIERVRQEMSEPTDLLSY
jgi:hypothetical protein